MTKDEALRLALEALETKYIVNCGAWRVQQDQAITAIKAALEAKNEPWEKFCDSHCVWTDHHPNCKLAKDEPVAWMNGWGDLFKNLDDVERGQTMQPLYTTPPQQEAKNEPDYKALWQQMCERCDELDKKLAHLEAKDEPVAWMYDWTTSEGEFIQNWTTSEAETLRDTEPTIITNVRPLYTTPPQRKPLTDKQIEAIAKEHIAVGTRSFEEFARRIEAAHGIKGEA